MSEKEKQIKPPKTEDRYAAAYDPQIARRLLAFIWPYRRSYALGFAFMLIESTAVVGGPYLLSRAIDDGIAVGNIVLSVGDDLFAGECDGPGRAIRYL